MMMGHRVYVFNCVSIVNVVITFVMPNLVYSRSGKHQKIIFTMSNAVQRQVGEGAKYVCCQAHLTSAIKLIFNQNHKDCRMFAFIF